MVVCQTWQPHPIVSQQLPCVVITCSHHRTSSCFSVCSSCQGDLGSEEELMHSHVPPLFRTKKRVLKLSETQSLQLLVIVGSYSEDCWRFSGFSPLSWWVTGRTEEVAVIGTCWTLFGFGAIAHRLRRYFSPRLHDPWHGFSLQICVRVNNDWILPTWPCSGRYSMAEEAQAPAAHFQTGPDWRLRVQWSDRYVGHWVKQGKAPK